MKHSVSVDTDLGIDWQDAGPWRSFRLYSEGSTFDELRANAWIEEVDQDGGTLRDYGLDKAEYAVAREAVSVLTRALTKSSL